MAGVDCHVAIVGAGLVGASLAAALGRAGLEVVLVEPAPPAAPAAQWDARIYAISPAARDFLGALGVWDALDAARIQPVARMAIFGDAAGSRLEFSAYEAGIGALAHIAESARLAHALWDALGRTPGVRRLAPARCADLAVDARGATLALEGGATVRTELVVGADGAQSWVRRAAGLTARATSYGELGVVANFAAAAPHGATACQWFRPDGVLAWLPLPGNRMSMVWSTADAHARELLELPADRLCRRVGEAGRAALGGLELVTPARGFPLQRLTAESMIAPRVALVGDAAHVVHPLAGQGVNLGFGDAQALARALEGREPFRDCGDRAVLRRYERSRAEAILALRSVTDGLARLFAAPGAAAARARNLGLSLTDRSALVKNLLVARAIA